MKLPEFRSFYPFSPLLVFLLYEKSKDAEESDTESATSEKDYSEAVKAAVDAIELEGGLEAVKEKIRLLQSLLD